MISAAYSSTLVTTGAIFLTSKAVQFFFLKTNLPQQEQPVEATIQALFNKILRQSRECASSLPGSCKHLISAITDNLWIVYLIAAVYDHWNGRSVFISSDPFYNRLRIEGLLAACVLAHLLRHTALQINSIWLNHFRPSYPTPAVF